MYHQVRFALFGCGNIAKKHSFAIASCITNAKLTAVCDFNLDKARILGKKYGVPWFSNAAQMMKQEGKNIDVINILTPSGYHCDNVLQLATYGKHLCVEKPMALNVEDADTMIEVCKKAGIRLFVVHQNRFNVPVQKLFTALEQGRFGKLLKGSIKLRWHRSQNYYDQDSWRGTRALDGGMFINQAYHLIDLLQWLMGDVQSVTAKGTRRLADIETEDTGVAILQFGNGSLGTIEATTAAIPTSQEASLTILGEHGTVEIAGFAVNEMRIWDFMTPQPDDLEILNNGCQNPSNVSAFSHTNYLKSVVETLTKGTPPFADGHSGKQTLELISAIYRSMAKDQEISLSNQQFQTATGSLKYTT